MNKSDIKNIAYIVRNAKTNLYFFIIIVAAGIISSLFSVIPTQFIGFLTDVVVNNNSYQYGFFGNLVFSLSRSATWIDPLYFYVLLFFATSIMYTILRNVFCYMASLFSNNLVLKTRQMMFRKLLKQEYKYFEETKRGQIIYNIITDTSNLDYIFSTPLYTLGSDLLDLIWISIFIVMINPVLLVLLLVMTPVIYIVSVKTAKAQRRFSKLTIEQENKMTTYVDQVVSGIEVIKTYKGEKKEEAVFSTANRNVFRFRKNADKNLSIYFPMETSLRTIGLSMLLVYSLFLVKNGGGSIGLLPIVFLYGNRFYAPISNFTKYYQTIQRGLVSLTRICDFLLKQEESIDQTREAERIGDCDIKLRDVCLKFDDKQVLHHFSHQFYANHFFIIKGESGSGKSSLLKVILGLKAPDLGEIQVNNTSPDYSYFAYAGQNCFLHDTTVMNNVLYPLDSGQCDAATIEKAKSILLKLGFREEELFKMVGEGGVRLSGGEKQRVNLARALLKEAPVLVLDEITSNVDVDTENRIAGILGEMKGERMVLLVTHSMNDNLLEMADEVIKVG